ncbi:hypothetical protein JB92DRAFT_640671 [Gautieria morchelliformis]|nr:hypothetical protein JB92DRAFT_640671 [Gautieria morchelliformis]
MPVHMTPPPTDPSHQDIIWLAGPRLLGILFNWCLLGALTMQIYLYFLNFPNDRRFIKFIIYVLYIIDWAQTCSATYDAFQWFVYGWGSINALYNVYTSYLNVPILSSIIGAVVQIFFGWRIWTFSKSNVLFCAIILLALLQLGGGGAVAYFLATDPSEVTRSNGLVFAVGIRLGGSALVDTVVAITMTYYLLKVKEQAVGRMNNVLTRLIRLTIETGTVTALAAIVDLVFFVSQKNGLHQVSGVILGKLYTNTLLVLFNNRMVMAAKDFDQYNIPTSGQMTFGSSSHQRLTSKGRSPMHHARKERILDIGKDSEVQNDTTNSDWS